MRTGIALVAAAALTACAHPSRFRPALAEQAVPGLAETGFAEVAEVRVWARPGGWSGWPDDLENRLTPVETTIENRSRSELRIRPAQFGLVGPTGFRYAPLSPEQVARELADLGHGGWGFYGVPPYWAGPWWPYPPYGPHWPYGPAFRIWLDHPPGAAVWWYGLPPGMPERAAREGTLEAGGNVSLMLFFPVAALELPSLAFTAEIEDAKAGEPLGMVRIPFVRTGAAPPPPVPPPAAPAPPAKGG